MVNAPATTPRQPTRLIGRERELAAARELLLGSQARILTLTGVGGAGKTRLAQALAVDVRAECNDHVFWARLASIADGIDAPRAIAGALGVIEAPGTPLLDSLTHRLAAPPSLLVLDNCEHLLDACSRPARTCACSSPAASRSRSRASASGGCRRWRFKVQGSRFKAQGEAASPLERGTLNLEPEPPAAVRLFVERAQAVAPDFRLAPANAAVVAEICTRLAGIPLALELAAARVRVLTVQQILARLDETFRLLSGGSRAAPARQQTLQATLDWSHDLLTDPERACFRNLAVFAGSFDLEAAERVADLSPVPSPTRGGVPELGSAAETQAPPSLVGKGAGGLGLPVLDLLTRLIDKSLVLVDHDGPTARYHLLEPVRQYALAHLPHRGPGNHGGIERRSGGTSSPNGATASRLIRGAHAPRA